MAGEINYFSECEITSTTRPPDPIRSRRLVDEAANSVPCGERSRREVRGLAGAQSRGSSQYQIGPPGRRMRGFLATTRSRRSTWSTESFPLHSTVSVSVFLPRSDEGAGRRIASAALPVAKSHWLSALAAERRSSGRGAVHRVVHPRHGPQPPNVSTTFPHGHHRRGDRSSSSSSGRIAGCRRCSSTSPSSAAEL